MKFLILTIFILVAGCQSYQRPTCLNKPEICRAVVRYLHEQRQLSLWQQQFVDIK